MPESKIEFRQALGSIIETRSREVALHQPHRRQHLLLGALTKRPN